jgi:hypothetical protein
MRSGLPLVGLSASLGKAEWSDIDALRRPTKMLPPHGLRQYVPMKAWHPCTLLVRLQHELGLGVRVFCLAPQASIQQDNKATYE